MGASLGGGGGGQHGRYSYRKNRFNEINVTPFVDVMLVLLIIFMVTAPMMTAGVQVDLPQSNATPIQGEDEPLSVTVSPGGKVYVQKMEVQVKDLRTKLGAITREKKDTRIFVRGDKTVDYGRIMEVVGEINAAGYGKVALVTEINPQAGGR